MKYFPLIPIILSLIAGLMIVLLTNSVPYITPLVLGMIAGGLVEVDNRWRGRIQDFIFILFLFAFIACSVQILYHHKALFYGWFIFITFALIVVGTLGQRYKTIAFGGLGVAIYSTLTHRAEWAFWINPVFMLLGAFLYGSFSLLMEKIMPNQPVKVALSQTYLKLADYLSAKALFFNPDLITQLADSRNDLAEKNASLIHSFNQCRSVLFYRSPTQFLSSIRDYFRAQDIHERISSSHVHYYLLHQELRHSDFIFRVKNLLELQAEFCRDMALKKKLKFQRLNQALLGLEQSLNYLLQTGVKNANQLKKLVRNLADVNQQFNQLEALDVDARIHQVEYSANQWWSVLKSQLNLSNSSYRHALRMTALVASSFFIIELFKLDLGYWILLTALFVCQPNYSATLLRINQRIIGTFLGVLVSAFIPFLLPTVAGQLAVIVIATILFFYFRTQDYSYSTFFITVEALTAFHLTGLNLLEAIPMRLLNTLIGGGLTWLAVRYLWADWRYLQEKAQVQRVFSSIGDYLNEILNQWEKNQIDDLNYRIARRQTHEQAIQLSVIIQELKSRDNQTFQTIQNAQELAYILISHISALNSFRTQGEPISFELLNIGKNIAHLIQNNREELRLEIIGELNQQQNEDDFIPQQYLWLLSALERLDY